MMGSCYLVELNLCERVYSEWTYVCTQTPNTRRIPAVFCYSVWF